MSGINNIIDPPRADKSRPGEPSCFGVLVAILLDGLVAFPEMAGGEIVASLARSVLTTHLREKGLLCQNAPGPENGFRSGEGVTCFVHVDRVLALFAVNNLNLGLAAIKEQLASVNALPHTVIGYTHQKTGKLERLWPHPANAPQCQLWTELLAAIEAATKRQK